MISRLSRLKKGKFLAGNIYPPAEDEILFFAATSKKKKSPRGVLPGNTTASKRINSSIYIYFSKS